MTRVDSDADERIDPEIGVFVAAILDVSAEDAERARADVTLRRAAVAAGRVRWVAGGPEMKRREDLVAAGTHDVRIRLLDTREAGGAPRPALVYVHGGGFVLFSLDTHDRLMREYAARADMIVIGVDYSLSPEARYPVALNEVVAAVDWVHDNAAALGIDPGRIAIGGDSAGANLSLAACLALRDRGDGDSIAGMVLNYGFFDADFDTPSQHRHGTAGNLLTTDELEEYLVAYLGDDHDRADPLALPGLSALHDLPPSLHVIAQCDPLADSDRALAARMRAAGNNVAIREFAGATHSFLEAISVSATADAAFSASADWLIQTLAHDFGGR